METFFIIVIAIAVVYQHIAIIAYSSEAKQDYVRLQKRIDVIFEKFNQNSNRSNEHLRAFKELADLLGYCVHEEHKVKFDLYSIVGQKKPDLISVKLFVHKKEPTVPVKKLKVKSKK